jgi:PKD repeat protein
VVLKVINDKGIYNTSIINLVVSPPTSNSENGTPEPATDNERYRSSKTQEINVAEPRPEAVVTYSPTTPKVGETVTFDASQSKDERGQIIGYEWDFGDGYSGKGASIKHSYLGYGNYDVKLTVTNDRGIQNTSSSTVFIRQAEDSSKIETLPVVQAFRQPLSNDDKTQMLGSGNAPPGTIQSTGYEATVTIRSAQYKGYDITVDSNYIGTDGKGQDLLDGIFTFKVNGNQQHLIRVDHPYNWKWWQYVYNAGESYTYDF